MDAIDKALAKFTDKERKEVHAILEKLTTHNLQSLHIKKLKGRNDIFRVRKGRIRVIYQTQGAEIFILAVDRRSEKTYKGI